MSEHGHLTFRGLWLALARQVIDMHSTHGLLHFPQSEVRVAVTSVAAIVVVNCYATYRRSRDMISFDP